MSRFFLDTKIEDPQNIVIKDKDIISKLTKVLRKQVGDTFFVFDNQAEEYLVEIKDMSDKEIICSFIEKNDVNRELDIQINLYQALLKKDKFEWVVQKATEIGARKITPFVSRNCVVRELNVNKRFRYHKIIKEATLQSGSKVPAELIDLIEYDKMITELDQSALNLIAYEDEKITSLKSVLNQQKTINIIIGPEGGFSQEEIDLAKRYSVIPVSLGKRILRAETAALVACALIANN